MAFDLLGHHSVLRTTNDGHDAARPGKIETPTKDGGGERLPMALVLGLEVAFLHLLIKLGPAQDFNVCSLTEDVHVHAVKKWGHKAKWSTNSTQ